MTASIYLCKECKAYRRSIRNRWKSPGRRAFEISESSCAHCPETAELKKTYGDRRKSGCMRILNRKINKLCTTSSPKPVDPDQQDISLLYTSDAADE